MKIVRALTLFLIPLLALGALYAAGHHLGHVDGGLLLATVPLVLPPAMKAKQEALGKILKELEAGQKEMTEGNISQTRGEELEAKAKEAETLQKEIDQFSRFASLTGRGREAVDPTLPAGTKAQTRGDDVVGYKTLGGAFISSAEFKQFQEMGLPQGPSGSFGVKNIHSGLVPVTREEMESKAIATVGADVIIPQRDVDVVRTTEQDRLVLRSILNVQQTDSNLVEYATLTSTTRAAAPVAESAQKPEATLAVGTGSAPVRTVAVWMPITEQQLQDVPQLRGIIDNELLYDLAKVEEEEIIWGPGTGQHLLGIMNAVGVAAARAVGGDTIIDSIRRMITDIAVAGGQANAVAIDPLDFETVVLTKGTDDRYIWTVAPGADGAQRIWALRAVETVAMRQPIGLGGGSVTQARRVLVGDFQRGATLWDRQQANVAVGFINDQFIRNQRTIRAEERLAFGVKRPKLFRYLETQANANS